MNHPRLPLRLPVFAAPMFLISGPEMVMAACKAGIVGAFPTPNARPIDKLDEWMKAITEGLAAARDVQGADTVGPWCANLVTHSSNTRLAQDLALIAHYKPPVVVTALGSPKPAIEVVHGYGGRVFADVINLTLAQKAVKAGADGLACVSAGAGGHTGFLSPFAFVSAIREFFDGEVVLGGGISDACLSENMRMPVGHFAVDGRNHIIECEQTLFLCQLGMEHHLEQQIAEFGPEILRLTALDGISDLIGFFDGIWCQGFEILLKIPWTAAFGITQGPHDCQQLLYRRAHSQSCQPMDRSPTAMKCGLSSDSLPL